MCLKKKQMQILKINSKTSDAKTKKEYSKIKRRKNTKTYKIIKFINKT